MGWCLEVFKLSEDSSCPADGSVERNLTGAGGWRLGGLLPKVTLLAYRESVHGAGNLHLDEELFEITRMEEST